MRLTKPVIEPKNMRFSLNTQWLRVDPWNGISPYIDRKWLHAHVHEVGFSKTSNVTLSGHPHFHVHLNDRKKKWNDRCEAR